MFTNSNYYVYVFLLLCMFCSVYSVSLYCSVYCLCVNVYCITATGCQPNCSQQIYIYIYIYIYIGLFYLSIFLKKHNFFNLAVLPSCGLYINRRLSVLLRGTGLVGSHFSCLEVKFSRKEGRDVVADSSR